MLKKPKKAKAKPKPKPKPAPKPAPKPVVPKPAPMPVPKPVRPPMPKPVGPNSIPPMPRPPMPVKPNVRPPMPKPVGPNALPPMPQPPMPAGPGGDITPAPLNPAQMAANAKKFCQSNCVINPAARVKRCLEQGKLVPCRRCTNNPAKKDIKLKQTCELVCNAHTVGGAPCDFYGYLNNSKKKHSRAALAKFE